MRISNIFQAALRVFPTKIMGRPIFSNVTIVVGAVPVASAVKHWTIALTGSELGAGVPVHLSATRLTN